MTDVVLDKLTRSPGCFDDAPVIVDDPLGGDDFQLALYLCYELHYRGLEGVDEGWEWDPELLRFRARLERAFEAALRENVPPVRAGGTVPDRLASLVAGDRSPSLSAYLMEHGTTEQFREFLVHRSAYQLKEADPHTWAIPRLWGRPKAAMIEIQSEEYGDGDAAAMHSSLFSTAMRAFGLDPAYGGYLDLIPGTTLATVNLMSMFGLHRRWRGAIVGHLAAFEMTSTEPNRRYASGLKRLGFGRDALHFFLEHVEADATHEILAARDLAGGLVEQEPFLADDVLFGAATLLELESRFAAHLLGAWSEEKSSLREPIVFALSA